MSAQQRASFWQSRAPEQDMHLRRVSWETCVVEDWGTTDAWLRHLTFDSALCCNYKAAAFKGYWSSHYPLISPPGFHCTQIFHPSIIANTFLWVNFSLFLKVMSQTLNYRQRRKGRNAKSAASEVISQRVIFTLHCISNLLSLRASSLSPLPASDSGSKSDRQQRLELWTVIGNVFNSFITKKTE